MFSRYAITIYIYRRCQGITQVVLLCKGQYSAFITASFAFKLIPTKAKHNAQQGKSWTVCDLSSLPESIARKKTEGFMGMSESQVVFYWKKKKRNNLQNYVQFESECILPLSHWLSLHQNNHLYWPTRVNITALNSISASTHSFRARQWIIQQGQERTACQEHK